MKSEKGITLTSLVITIIILLILATIAVYSGIGTVRYAGYNKAKSEMEMMQANVNDWYQEYQNVEVKDEEVGQGQTKEQVKATKQQAVIAKYGEAITDSETLTKTVNATGITSSDYKYFSESYLKETLGLNASFEFLINIPSRTVILFGGYSYNGRTYYTAEDFGLLNVGSTEMSGITFNLAQGDNTDVIISDLKLSYGENNAADISKFIVQYRKTNEPNANWNDATSSVVKFTDEADGKVKYKFSVPIRDSYNVNISTIDKNISTTKDIQVIGRAGIEVGDYITYVPTAKDPYSEHLTENYTGSSSNGSISQQYNIWRVLNKNADGTLDIMPAFKDSGVTYTDIYFNDAKGWNNAPYILDEVCDYLYANKAKGITARSIDYEDITSHLKEGSNDSEGLRKIAKYQSDQVASLNPGSGNITGKTGTKITYQTDTWHPVLWPDVRNNLSSRYYNENHPFATNATNNGKIGTKPDSLEVDYTYYGGTISASDFKDYANNQSNAHSVIFGTGTYYWLASRCVNGDSAIVYFYLRGVYVSNLYANFLFYSTGDDAFDMRGRVCPLVSLGPSVQVTTGNNASSADGTPHTVVIN